jgi:hypothetical protein
LRLSPTLPGGLWRFTDKSYSFINPSQPFDEDFPEMVKIRNVSTNSQAQFVAIKLGDVNNTYLPPALIGSPATEVRTSATLVLKAEDIDLKAGQEYTIPITSEDFNATDYQFTLSFTEGSATPKSIKVGDLPNLTDGSFGIFKKDITTSWYGKVLDKKQHLFNITFKADKNAKLSEILTLGSALTPKEAHDANGNPMNVQLSFTNGVVSGGEFALYQNRPNPFDENTKIGFNLPTETTARLTIYTIDGKAIKVIDNQYKAGYNEVTLTKEELSASGILYYRLDTPEYSATKKMIMIK